MADAKLDLPGKLDCTSTPEEADARDDALERLLHHTQSHMELAARSSEAFAKGFHSLSRARMHLGSTGWNTLGGDGWDGRLRAQIRCQVDMDRNGRTSVRLVRQDTVDKAQEEGTSGMKEGVDDSASRDEGLRRRAGKGSPASRVDRSSEQRPENAEGSGFEQVHEDDAKKASAYAGERMAQSDKRSKQAPDPLYQFTALPPASLRSAQASFREALGYLLGSVEQTPQHAMEHEEGTTCILQVCTRLRQLEEDMAGSGHR